MSTTTTVNSKAATWIDAGHPSTIYYGKTSYLALAKGKFAGLVQFANPTPPGSQNVQRAYLTLRTNKAAGPVTITVARLLNPWTPSRAGWVNTKQQTADAVTITRSDANQNGTVWRFDVTAMVQHWASGARNYGVLLTTTNPGTLYVVGNYSANVNPQITATYTQAPLAPAHLAPAGGRRIGTPRPVVRFSFQDQAGNTTLQAAQVQLATDAAMSANLWDSGRVAVAVPEVDLDALNAKVPAEGTPFYWRVRTQDGSGLWSDWSAPAQAVHTALPTVTLLNPDPKSPVVNDHTPPIDWTYSSASGSNQTRWRVVVYAPGKHGDLQRYADSGVQFGTDTVWTPPRALPHPGTYRAVVDVWDGYTDREAVPDTPTWGSAWQDFTFQALDYIPAPAAGKASKPTPGMPALAMSWTRADEPDEWRITRDGELLTLQDGDVLAVGSNTYQWTDHHAPAGRHTYTVAAVVNGKVGEPLTLRPINSFTGTWLVHDDTGEMVCLVSDEDHGLTLPEQATEVDVLGAQVPVRIVTGMQGYTGKADGMLLPIYGLPTGQDPDTWAERLLDFKGQVGQTFTLLGVGPLLLTVLLREVDVSPVSDLNGPAWSASFTYVQCADFPDGLEG